ncbi:hypothetical protein B0H13DRAFT_1503936, partial [Mycena leptocephala]
PHGGEVDVLEGVHAVNTNKMKLHTSENCNIDHREQMLGKAYLTNCTSSNRDNQGCGVLDGDMTSYGRGFNQAGDGVY